MRCGAVRCGAVRWACSAIACADDVSALVADLGSATTRIGHAGEDFPKAYLSSVSGAGKARCVRACVRGDGAAFPHPACSSPPSLCDAMRTV